MSHYVDIHVGQKIRRRRWMTDMTQKQLADAVGIKFQQIQKYETGANRVSASRLFEISQALDVPVSYFFESIEGAHDGDVVAIETATDENAVPADLFQGKEAIELLNCYYRWPEEQRRRLFELTKSLTKEGFAAAA
jgi:transcriptional regulator with XRE-family HTH domain